MDDYVVVLRLWRRVLPGVDGNLSSLLVVLCIHHLAGSLLYVGSRLFVSDFEHGFVIIVQKWNPNWKKPEKTTQIITPTKIARMIREEKIEFVIILRGHVNAVVPPEDGGCDRRGTRLDLRAHLTRGGRHAVRGRSARDVLRPARAYLRCLQGRE